MRLWVRCGSRVQQQVVLDEGAGVSPVLISPSTREPDLSTLPKSSVQVDCVQRIIRLGAGSEQTAGVELKRVLSP